MASLSKKTTTKAKLAKKASAKATKKSNTPKKPAKKTSAKPAKKTSPKPTKKAPTKPPKKASAKQTPAKKPTKKATTTSAEPGDTALNALYRSLQLGWKPPKLKDAASRWSTLQEAARFSGSSRGRESVQDLHPESDDIVGLSKEFSDDGWSGSVRVLFARCLDALTPEQLQKIVPAPTTNPQEDIKQHALSLLRDVFIEEYREAMLSWAERSLEDDEDFERDEEGDY